MLHDPREIRAVSRVSKVVLPEDVFGFDQKDPWHSPGVSHRSADAVPFQSSPHSAPPDLRSEHLWHATTLDAERIVEPLVRIRDCPSLRPEPAKERGALINSPHVEEKDRGIGGIGGDDLAQVADALATKDSPEMTEKNK